MRLWLPKIEIHAWGGLGSQLYAWALRIEIMERYPNRDVEMHLHTSGVTKRLSELDGVVDSSSVVLVSDFSESEVFEGLSPKRINHSAGKEFFKSRMLPILLIIGFVSRFDNVEQKLRVYPWLRQIRGHYSNRRIPMPILKRMYSDLLQLGYLNADLPIPEPKGIHYRLGDLLEIGTKNPTSIENLKVGIELANRLNPEKDCLVFSDSVNSACKMLASQSLGLEYKSGSGNTWKAIRDLVRIEIFIGTASKVTEWITIFRLLRDTDSISIVPKSLKPLIERQFGTSVEFRNLYFY